MGTDATSTTYAAELQGINLALAMAKAEVGAGSCQKLINIFADNQAAIRSLTRPEGRSGAFIVKQIATKVESLQKSGQKVVVRWIPSHEGIEGNEAADIKCILPHRTSGCREKLNRVSLYCSVFHAVSAPKHCRLQSYPVEDVESDLPM